MTERYFAGLRSRLLICHLRVVVAAVLAMPPTPLAAAETPAGPELQLSIAGETSTVFSKARDACDAGDIPDAPARAIRVASGTVQLYAPHFHNRRLTGPDLRHLSQDCRVVLSGNERDDPAAFDDRSWLTSLYTEDGHTIYAALHNEFQGHRRKSLCPSGRYIDCWYNALTAAISTDGGARFQRIPGDRGLLAAIPYRYEDVPRVHVGYFNPSNIIRRDGALYMMMFATEVMAQKPGNCLMRTDHIADPGAWRGWDGKGFSIAFINPYEASDKPESHVCTPVGGGRLRWPVTSLVRHESSGLFIAVMLNGAHGGGVFYATSPDLVTWSPPSKLLDGLGEGPYRCNDPSPIAYPSLIDPASTDRNFSTIGQSADLFFTRFNVKDCRTSMDRDLERVRVSVSR